MKKIYALISVFLMLVSFGAAAHAQEAQSVDFSAMSLDELLKTYEAVRNEILTRIGTPSDNLIGRGTYTVGKTILAGTYDFICTESSVYSDNGYVNNQITVTDTDYTRIFESSKISVGGHVTFTLSDGDILEIEGCSGTISIIVDPTWVP